MDTRHKRMNWAALIAGLSALATAGVEAWRGSSHDDVNERVVARHHLEGEQRYEFTRTLITDLGNRNTRQAEQIARLRESVGELRGAIDLLSRGRRRVAREQTARVGELLEGADEEPVIELNLAMPEAMPSVEPEAVRRKAKALYETPVVD